MSIASQCRTGLQERQASDGPRRHDFGNRGGKVSLSDRDDLAQPTIMVLVSRYERHGRQIIVG